MPLSDNSVSHINLCVCVCVCVLRVRVSSCVCAPQICSHVWGTTRRAWRAGGATRGTWWGLLLRIIHKNQTKYQFHTQTLFHTHTHDGEANRAVRQRTSQTACRARVTQILFSPRPLSWSKYLKSCGIEFCVHVRSMGQFGTCCDVALAHSHFMPQPDMFKIRNVRWIDLNPNLFLVHLFNGRPSRHTEIKWFTEFESLELWCIYWHRGTLINDDIYWPIYILGMALIIIFMYIYMFVRIDRDSDIDRDRNAYICWLTSFMMPCTSHTLNSNSMYIFFLFNF